MPAPQPVTRDPAWIAYDAALKTYEEQLAAYNQAVASSGNSAAINMTRAKELQARAALLVSEIEAREQAVMTHLMRNTIATIDSIEHIGGIALAGELHERIPETRFYTATFVTDWGEESAPSQPSDMVEPDQNDTVLIQRPNSTRFGSALSSNHIDKWRIYRSASGSAAADFLFVAELPISTTQFTDKLKGQELGEPCPSLTWEPPPYRQNNQSSAYPKPSVGTNPYLRGLSAMPNGIMAGFFDRTVAFCQPYIPYAWPIEYQISLEHDVVGLGVFGQTLFVGTTGYPYFISGADSASMSAQKLDAPQACSSARSIVGIEGGVLYASPDGLCLADASGVKVISQGLFNREDWQKLTPATMHAAHHEGIYYLWYSGNGGGCLAFDLASKKLGRADITASATYNDIEQDTLYTVQGSAIINTFGGTTRRNATWKSAKLTLPAQAPLAWLKVYGEQSASTPITIKWYGDGQLQHTTTVTNLQPQRLPPGRWLEHEIEIQGQARATKIVLAGSTQELQQV